ncbi:MAG: GHKL domain-containing protein [Lachnospiraceae bacterium]|nr:GHKL domain-containing protein [Lachnospiraceae bacterium]
MTLRGKLKKRNIRLFLVLMLGVSAIILLIFLMSHEWFPSEGEVLSLSWEELQVWNRSQFISAFYYFMYLLSAVILGGHILHEEYELQWFLLLPHALLAMIGSMGGIGDMWTVNADGFYALSVVPLFLYVALMFRSCQKLALPPVLMYSICSASCLLLESAQVSQAAEDVAEIMCTWIFFAVLLILLLLAHLESHRKNRDVQYFLRVFYLVFASFLLCAGFSILFGKGQNSANSFYNFWKYLRSGDLDSLRIYYVQWLFTGCIIFSVVLQYAFRWHREWTERQLLSIRMESALEYAENGRKYVDEVREIRHDMSRHLSTLHLYLQEGRTEEAASYLEELEGQLEASASTLYSTNILVNYLVEKYARQAAEHQTRFASDIRIPETIGVADSDLCSLTGNILENAVEACAAQPDGGDIRLSMRLENHVLRVSCSNSFAGELEEGPDGYRSTKEAPLLHGYGLRIIRKICDNYGGALSVRTEGRRFYLKAAVPEMQQESQ